MERDKCNNLWVIKINKKFIPPLIISTLVLGVFIVLVNAFTFSNTQLGAVSLTPLTNSSFVLAFCDETNDDISFEIWNTSGVNITAINASAIDVDTDVGDCSGTPVKVSALNTTTFVIAYFDDTDDDATFAIYDSNGTQRLAPTDAYTSSGGDSVGLAVFNSSTFVICYDDYQYITRTASFKIFNTTGGNIVSAVQVDAGIGNGASLDCSALNSTHFVWGETDISSDDISFQTFNSSGTSTSAFTVVDGSPGTTNPRISVSAVNSTHFVLAWYSITDKRTAYVIYTSSGVSVVAKSYFDQLVGTQPNGMATVTALNSTHWAGGFHTQFFATFNYTIRKTDNTTIFTSTAISGTSGYPYNDIVSFEPATGIGLCNQSFIFAYVTASTYGDWTAYFPNGTAWNGICPSATTPPTDSCTYTSGTWLINCADNCQITTNTNMNGNAIIFYGSGSAYLNANIQNFTNRTFSPNCPVTIGAGKVFG